MMTYGTEQVGMEQKLNPTSVWVRNVPDLVSKPFALSSNSENRGTSIETRQETRLPAGAQIRQFGRLTMPMSRNAQSFAHFRVLESWVGKVAQVANGQFTALVFSDKHPEVSETAEFTFEEISEDDRSIVKVGAIFYWSVGYQINEYGGRITASTVRFQRIRHWTRKELDAAKTKASEYTEWFLGA